VAVGVGSVRGEVLVGDVCDRVRPFLPGYFVVSLIVLAFKDSVRYVWAAAVTVVVVLAQCCLFLPPGGRQFGLAEQWAAGHEGDRATALECTYTFARRAVARGVVSSAISIALLLVVVGAIAGASLSRLVQYGMLGAALGTGNLLIAAHSFVTLNGKSAAVQVFGLAPQALLPAG
jgi:adenylate cyclase